MFLDTGRKGVQSCSFLRSDGASRRSRRRCLTVFFAAIRAGRRAGDGACARRDRHRIRCRPCPCAPPEAVLSVAKRGTLTSLPEIATFGAGRIIERPERNPIPAVRSFVQIP